MIAEKGYTFYLSYLPKVLLAVIISILDEAYFTVAKWLNDVGKFIHFLCFYGGVFSVVCWLKFMD